MDPYGAHMGPYGAHMGPYTRKIPKNPRKFLEIPGNLCGGHFLGASSCEHLVISETMMITYQKVKGQTEEHKT